NSSGVYIADTGNSRVLFYPGTTITATRVYGQNNSFTSNTCDLGGVDVGSLCSPIGIAADATGVYVADTSNNRVLFYSSTNVTPTRVYGQNGSFTSANCNTPSASAGTLCGPRGLTLDSSGLY